MRPKSTGRSGAACRCCRSRSRRHSSPNACAWRSIDKGPGLITHTDPITVVAAVIEHDDRFLLTRRQDGVHLAGYWEFPGGKVGSGESHATALRREIVEELDTDVVVHELVLETMHAYPEKTVTLFFYRCDLLGIPKPMLGQHMEWVRRTDLASLMFPAADAALITTLTAG